MYIHCTKPNKTNKIMKPIDILKKLRDGGKIVSTNDLDHLEIGIAYAGDTIFVDDDSFGYVYVSPPTTDKPKVIEHNCDNCKYEHDDHSFNCNKCDELFCMWEAKPVEYDCDTCKHYPCVGLGGGKITKGLCGDYKKVVKMNITHFTERDDDKMSAEDVLVKTYGCIDVDELKRCFITDNISITLIKEAMEQYKTNL